MAKRKNRTRIEPFSPNDLSEGQILISPVLTEKELADKMIVKLPVEPCPACNDGVDADGKECRACNGVANIPTIGGIKQLQQSIRQDRLANDANDAENRRQLEMIRELLHHGEIPQRVRAAMVQDFEGRDLQAMSDISILDLFAAEAVPLLENEIVMAEAQRRAFEHELKLTEDVLDHVRRVHTWAAERDRFHRDLTALDRELQALHDNQPKNTACSIAGCEKKAREWDVEGNAFCRPHAHDFGLHGSDPDEDEEDLEVDQQ